MLPLLSSARTLDCSISAFQAILPSTATVVSANWQADNSTFQVPSSNVAYPVSPTNLRALCAVEVNVTSSLTSAYGFGLFLPREWNTRFLAVGNGGFAGGVNWLDMGAGVGYGFAVMSTDTGHSSVSTDGRWALNEESVNDWGYRAMHGSVVLAKDIVEAYYSSPPVFNYFSGCSTGGRQGLKEVELYPEDFDGVLAGAPAWWTSHLQPWTVNIALYNLPNTTAGHIPRSLFPAIEAEVLRQCDGADGLVDSIISSPRECNFSSEALLCGSDTVSQTRAGCLTAPQLGTLSRIYADYYGTNHTFVLPGLELGSEAQWEVLLGGNEPAGLGTDYVRYFLLKDPDWDFNDYNDSIVDIADKLQPGNATVGLDLSAFHAKGGKLLQYHGMADALIPTGSSSLYYTDVARTLRPRGVDLDSWYRHFLVPGMQHCSGTPAGVEAPWYFAGANQAGRLGTGVSGVPGFRDPEHDALLALMEWTEKGQAPDRIIATKWKSDALHDEVLRQRPLCPYPHTAKYGGNGDPDLAESWACDGLFVLQQQ
ncbi:putative ferulic acid Esterase/Feruloyl esterase [Zymoseptoria tritici IPO323]|uniref:Carboxylic ester hydrolase n=1 Tax=Zymoseptoria tritici (strain CBS 115943 / IPO323) TaxID=336722 RepID=F9WY86_ZYMTI|nr:putative ferulic acid Esterase/Feruloyl esterase [Zymoseptoria tritici IPO323]EGP91498.1 putative ferulic acid Esterase/Feruloyl esterase [Zymoseptoria tritici IPO323]